jgi:L-fuconate dehydratase
MLTTTLIHPQILAALASAGHGSQVLVADGNYPFSTGAPAGAEWVFLNLAPGLLDVTQVLSGLPVWQFLASMSPEEIVELADFRYLSDALSPGEALRLLRTAEPGKSERLQTLLAEGFPVYTTSPGWLGYTEAKLVDLAKAAAADGFEMIKLKVGGNLEDDRRRLRPAREAVGPDVANAVDANQRWDVG